MASKPLYSSKSRYLTRNMKSRYLAKNQKKNWTHLQLLEAPTCLHAVGQGALAVECRWSIYTFLEYPCQQHYVDVVGDGERVMVMVMVRGMMPSSAGRVHFFRISTKLLLWLVGCGDDERDDEGIHQV